MYIIICTVVLPPHPIKNFVKRCQRSDNEYCVSRPINGYGELTNTDNDKAKLGESFDFVRDVILQVSNHHGVLNSMGGRICCQRGPSVVQAT